MCSEHFHTCKNCGKGYTCDELDWVCPTMNFDENALLCKDCEHDYFVEMQSLLALEDKKRKERMYE